MTLPALAERCLSELRLRVAFRLGLVIGLYVGIYLVTDQSDLLSVAVLGGGLYIASEGLRLGYALVFCHYLIGIAAFLCLFLSIGIPALFAVLCGTLALGVIALTRWAADLRSFGNWIFIPAVYVACDLGEDRAWPDRLAALPHVLLFSLIGPAAVMALMFSRRNEPSKSLTSLLERLGHPNLHWMQQAVAAFLAVLLVAGVAVAFDLPNSEWMIWSSLSTIAIDLPASRAKFKDRTFGALIGCPVGFACGFLLPQNRVTFALATLGILVTLVAFRTYRLGFTFRCALTALAAVVAGGSVDIAEQRVINVIVGGVIGLSVQYLVVWGALALAHARRPAA